MDTIKPKVAKAAKPQVSDRRYPPSTVTLDIHMLRGVGLDLVLDDVRDGIVRIVPTGVMNEESVNLGRQFGESLGLGEAEIEEMFNRVEDLAVWAALRRSTKS